MLKVRITERDCSEYAAIELWTCCVEFERLNLGIRPDFDHMRSTCKLRRPNNIRFAYYIEAIVLVGQDDEVSA